MRSNALGECDSPRCAPSERWRRRCGDKTRSRTGVGQPESVPQTAGVHTVRAYIVFLYSIFSASQSFRFSFLVVYVVNKCVRFSLTKYR